MTGNSKTGWQKFIYYVWLPFSIFMTAVDLIQIGDNFWPTLIEWSDFFQYWIDSIRVFRNWFFSPFNWVNIKLSTGFKDYLLFGLFVSSNIVAGISYINKITNRDMFYHEWGKLGFLVLMRNVLSYLIIFLIMILFWPIYFAAGVIAASSKDMEENPRLSFIMMLKLMVRIILIASILILINYFVIAAKGD